MIRLDETTLRANLQIVLKGLDELGARQARLEAERDDDDRIDFPADLVARLRCWIGKRDGRSPVPGISANNVSG